MGNVNSSEVDVQKSDAGLMLFLIRHWSSEIESRDKAGTSKSENLSRRKRKLARDENFVAPSPVTNKFDSLGGETRGKPRKSRGSGARSVESYETCSKRDFLFRDIRFLVQNPIRDWERADEVGDGRNAGDGGRRDEIRGPESRRASGAAKMKRHFRGRGKTRRERDSQREYCSEMWTLAEKAPVHDGPSAEAGKVDDVDAENGDEPAAEKIFWKTSNLPLTDSKMLRDASGSLSGNANMLWRSSKHMRGFGGEADAGAELTPPAPATFGVGGNAEGSARVAKPLGNGERKRRFSRWTFLRHDKPEDDAEPRRESNPKRKPSRRAASFRVPQKMYSKYNQGARHARDSAIRGRRKWKIFDNVRNSGSEKCAGNEDEEESCDCSCCSCNGCQSRDRSERSPDSDSLSFSEGKMAPNSEEDTRILYQNSKSWRNENGEKESQRPPVYNPEDYALSLKKWGRKPNLGLQVPLYISQSMGSIERIPPEIAKSLQARRQPSPSGKSSSSSKNGDEKHSKKEKEMSLKQEKESKNKENIMGVSKGGAVKDLKNPIVTVAPQESEMSLRQFSSVTELLGKLKLDLRLAFPSFVQEFVGDPVDGVTLLLELLRAVQLSQAGQQQRCPPQVLRRALLDEHSCLVCLKHCLRCPDASRRLASSSAGLFTLTVCIMSNVTKSRIIALELLTKACEVPGSGHKPVSEALSTLRLRFGEPVRFRFLVGMLNSAGAVELLTAAMKFINTFIATAPSMQERVYIQAELEQAGFDSKMLRKTLPNHSEPVKSELAKWEKNYFDVEMLETKVAELESLRDKVQLLEKRVQILQEEKGILQSLEQCLKERCSELEEEVSIKTTTTTLSKSTAHIKPFRNYGNQQPQSYMNKRNAEKGESTPAEDEGISSSEQELSQDEDCARGLISYNIPPPSREQIPQNVTDRQSFEPGERKMSIRPASNQLNEKIVNSNSRYVRNGKMKETNVDDGNEVNCSGDEEDEEEETTIDEVIEELRNIVNDAETEVYGQENKAGAASKVFSRKLSRGEADEEAENLKSQPSARRNECDRDYFEEAEIVPSGLLPQPPRRTRSLVHIFLGGTDYEDNGKNEFFDDDTDTESSDSLLTAAREKRSGHKNCHHRTLEVSDSYNSSSSVNTRTLFIKQQNEYEDSDANAEDVKKHGAAAHAPEAKQQKLGSSDDRPNQRERLPPYESPTSFQRGEPRKTGEVDENPFGRRNPNFVPAPVKRSQTFHMAIPEGNRLVRKTEMRPKPKMGVSGLDLQRSAELKIKIKAEPLKYQNGDCKSPDRIEPGRYIKNASKDGERYNQYEKKSHPLQRRGSLDGLFFVTEVEEQGSPKKRLTRANNHGSCGGKQEMRSAQAESSDANATHERKNLRSKSLEKINDGLDSLVDIVFPQEQQTKMSKPSKAEWNVDASKNIGPRTRRSLAESSIFNQPFMNNLNKESPPPPKPPQPAQRTSLTRNSSSSIPLHMPVEIKVAPMRQHYNFSIKTAKSESNLVGSSPPKRYPPDGSSSPSEFSASQTGEGPQKKSNSKIEDGTIYAIPSKQSRIHKFFGNPRFENAGGGKNPSQKYFESNYACAQGSPDKKGLNPTPRNVQSAAGGAALKMKNLMANPKEAPKMGADSKEGPNGRQQKINFFLGTYQQSQAAKGGYLAGDAPPQGGGSSFGNSFLIKRSHVKAGMYSGANAQGCRAPVKGDAGHGNGRQSIISNYSSGAGSTKVTDSLSGLY